MSDTRAKERGWLQRFSAGGWLSLCLSLIALPPVYHVIHYKWGLDWFYTAVLGAILAVAAGHIILLPVLLILLRYLKPSLFCDICPTCGERALAPGMRISEPTADPTLHRVYQIAECHHCGRHFQRISDGSYRELENG